MYSNGRTKNQSEGEQLLSYISYSIAFIRVLEHTAHLPKWVNFTHHKLKLISIQDQESFLIDLLS